MTSSPRTITEDELAAYYRRHDPSSLAAEASGELAASVVADIERNREPEYEPGEIYLSPDGFRYMRLDGPPSGCWVELHANGSTAYRGDRRPERPLRKLVPEHSHPDEAAILAEIRAWAGMGYRFDVLAKRMCKLMEGGSDD